MLELSRTVRFCLNTPPSDGGGRPPRDNTFAAWPPMRGLGRYYEIHIRCQGEADPVTGYFINIKHIDKAFRQHGLPYLESLVTEEATASSRLAMGPIMRQLLDRLQPALDESVTQVRLNLTPYFSLELRSHDMEHLLMRQQYEFSAAHRLHVPDLSDEENRAVFGKCNNPSGHGHNYRVEVVARVPMGPDGRVLQCEQMDAVVDEVVIEKLDHKHLNVDVPEFAQMNPSVENIAKVIYRLLSSPVSDRLGAELEEISVWETGKTVCTFRG